MCFLDISGGTELALNFSLSCSVAPSRMLHAENFAMSVLNHPVSHSQSCTNKAEKGFFFFFWEVVQGQQSWSNLMAGSWICHNIAVLLTVHISYIIQYNICIEALSSAVRHREGVCDCVHTHKCIILFLNTFADIYKIASSLDISGVFILIRYLQKKKSNLITSGSTKTKLIMNLVSLLWNFISGSEITDQLFGVGVSGENCMLCSWPTHTICSLECTCAHSMTGTDEAHLSLTACLVQGQSILTRSMFSIWSLPCHHQQH